MAIHGAVVRLEFKHGFGFLRDDTHGDWFFVSTGVREGGLTGLRPGQRVIFEQEWTPSGPRATDIHDEPVS